MTTDNVIPLFGPISGSSEENSKLNTSNQESRNDLLQQFTKLDLDSKHPVTGLKYGGYLPLSFSIFTPEFFLLLNPGEFKLYLYLSALNWRYPSKPGHVRAALPYLAKGCGLSRASISNYLGSLEILGLIKTVEINHKDGNVYQVSSFAIWSSENRDQVSEAESSKNQTTKNSTTDESLDGSSPKDGSHPSKIWTKDLSSLSLLNSLSQHEGFKSRWNQMSKKRIKKERDAILSILKASPEDLNDIYEALLEIEKTGKTYNGAPCYSPIGLISSSWPAIKRIRNARKAVQHLVPTVTQNTHQSMAQTEFSQKIDQYLSLLDPQAYQELENIVETEIRKNRPQIVEIRKDSLIFRSFLETTIAARLGLEIPETN